VTRLTASSLDAAAACLGSAVLPGVDEEGEYSAGGAALHRFLEHARQDRDSALMAAPEEDRDFFAGLELETIPAGLSSEVALAYHPVRDEGRILEDTKGRAYPDLGAGWIYGTADLLGVVERDGVKRVAVPDLKRYQAPRSARASLQLGFYALAAARACGAEEAEVSFLVPRHDGRWYIDRAYLDVMDLAELRDRISDLRRRVARAAADVSEERPIPLVVGEQCTYCRARRLCPAQVTPLALAVRADLDSLAAEALPSEVLVKERITALVPEARGRLFSRASQLRDFLDTVLTTLRDDARQEPIPIGDGKELREVPWSAQAKSDVAKEELAQKAEELRQRGEIRKVATTQVRVVAVPGARRRKGKAA